MCVASHESDVGASHDTEPEAASPHLVLPPRPDGLMTAEVLGTLQS